MNDPVLNRKMFRHAAQIKHNQIPKYQTGTPPEGLRIPGASFAKGTASNPYKINPLKAAWWLASPGKYLKAGQVGIQSLVKGGKYAYGTYKAARAATKAAEKAGKGPTWKGTLPFTRTGKGPPSFYQSTIGKPISRHMMRHPKKYGTAKGLAGLGFGGTSAIYAVDAARKGDYGSAAFEASLIPFGGAWAAKGLQLATKGSKAKKTFKRAGGIKKILDKQAKWTVPLGLGGAGTAWYRGEGEGAQLGDDEQNLIMNIAQKVAIEAGANEITQEHVDKAVQIWQTDFAVREGQTGVEGDYDRNNPNEMNILTAETIPPAGGPSLNEDEAAILEAQKLKDAETQAKVLKEEFNSADLGTKDKFLKFRNQITDLTGAQGNDRDLLLMKLASGMMSNKSGEKGLKGFLDVVGQSTGPVTDTAIALNQSQRAFDKDLAIAFLKAQEENKLGPQKVVGDVKHVMVDDPNALYGKRVLEIREDENGQWVMQKQNPDGTISWPPFQGENPRSLEISGTTQHKMRTKLSSAATGLQYVNYVLSAPDEVLGYKGGWKLITEDYKGAIDNYQSYENKYTQGMSMGNYIDSTILAADNLETDTVKVGGKFGVGGETMTHAEWIQREYRKDIEATRKEVMDHYNDKDLTQQQLDQLMQVALIETRLKYIIANANKHEDRLTKWDIEAAAERTGALGIIPRPFKNQNVTAKTIKSAYRALQAQLIGNFNSDANNYLESGGNSAFLESFVVIPYINQWKIGSQVQGQSEEQVIGALESIPIPGA